MITTYDLEYTDDIKQCRYRIVTKAMTIRDGAAHDRLYADITKRKNEDGSELDNYVLLSLMRYPMLLHGTHRIEQAAIDSEDWLPIALSEDWYADLPELFVLEWYQAVITKNPHRDSTFESLKKFLAATSPTDSEGDLIPSPQNGKAAE